MKIRKAGLKDVSEIVKLGEKLWSYHDKKFKEAKMFNKRKKSAGKVFSGFVKKYIKGRNGLVLVAEDNGKIIAYNLNYIKNNIPIFLIEKIGYISGLYVDEKYRGKSISSEFSKKAFIWFKSKKIKDIEIAAYPQNKRAVSIYRKWGFKDYHLVLRRKL